MTLVSRALSDLFLFNSHQVGGMMSLKMRFYVYCITRVLQLSFTQFSDNTRLICFLAIILLY